MEDPWVVTAEIESPLKVETVQPLRHGGFMVRSSAPIFSSFCSLITGTGIFQFDSRASHWRFAAISTPDAYVSCVAEIAEDMLVIATSVGSISMWKRQEDWTWKSTDPVGPVVRELWIEGYLQSILGTAAGNQILCYDNRSVHVCDLGARPIYRINRRQTIPLPDRSSEISNFFQTEDGDVIVGMSRCVLILTQNATQTWQRTQIIHFTSSFPLMRPFRRNAFLVNFKAIPGRARPRFYRKNKRGEYVFSGYVDQFATAVPEALCCGDFRLDNIYAHWVCSYTLPGNFFMAAQIDAESYLLNTHNEILKFWEKGADDKLHAIHSHPISGHTECFPLFNESALVVHKKRLWIWESTVLARFETCASFMSTLAMLI